MLSQRRSIAGLAALPFFILAATARTDGRQIRWSELANTVGAAAVTVVVKGEVRLQGTIAGVRPDTLLIDVAKSSDHKAYAPGQLSVPRKDVAEVRLRKIRGPYRAILASGAGVGIFFATLPWAMSESRINVSDPKRITQHAFITAAGVAAGYFAGRAADTRETILRFAPD